VPALTAPAPAERYRELAVRVDAFFAKVLARHAADLACAPGCEACCHVRPTITPVEADEVRALLATLPAREREKLAARASEAQDDRCAALDDDGRCGVYAARPLVCRSHGVPVRFRDARSLPVVSACEKNFIARGPSAADPDCILDQETLSTILLAIDAAHARERGTQPGLREDLAEVLRRPVA
jgi:Fe-S-cluster containining protein